MRKKDSERVQKQLVEGEGPSMFNIMTEVPLHLAVMTNVLCFSPGKEYLRPSPHSYLLKIEVSKSGLFPSKTLSFPY